MKKFLTALLTVALLLPFAAGLGFTVSLPTEAAQQLSPASSVVIYSSNISPKYLLLSSSTTSKSIGGGTASFNASTGTLTLSGVTIKGYVYCRTGYLTVVLSGSNSITGKHPSGGYSLRSDYGMTIQGSGSLTVSSGKKYVIGTLAGDLKILGSCTINVTASDGDAFHVARQANGPYDMIFGGSCNVTARVTDTSEEHRSVIRSQQDGGRIIFRDSCTVNVSMSYGENAIATRDDEDYCGSVLMQGGNVTVTNSRTCLGWEGGMRLRGFDMTGGTMTLNITGKSSSPESVCGISVQDPDGWVNCSGGTLNLNIRSEVTNTDGRAFGIFVKGVKRTVFSGTTVNANLYNVTGFSGNCGAIVSQGYTMEDHCDIALSGGALIGGSNNNAPLVAALSEGVGVTTFSGINISGKGSYLYYSTSSALPSCFYAGNINFTASQAVTNRNPTEDKMTHVSGSAFGDSSTSVNCSGTLDLFLNGTTRLKSGTIKPYSGGTIRWDSATRTATIENVSTTDLYNITSYVPFRLVVNGTNEIGRTTSAAYSTIAARGNNQAEAIASDGHYYSIVIEGTGSLNLIGRRTPLVVSGGGLRVTDSVNLTVAPTSGTTAITVTSTMPDEFLRIDESAKVTLTTGGLYVSGLAPSMIVTDSARLSVSGIAATTNAIWLRQTAVPLTVETATESITISGSSRVTTEGGKNGIVLDSYDSLSSTDISGITAALNLSGSALVSLTDTKGASLCIRTGTGADSLASVSVTGKAKLTLTNNGQDVTNGQAAWLTSRNVKVDISTSSSVTMQGAQATRETSGAAAFAVSGIADIRVENATFSVTNTATVGGTAYLTRAIALQTNGSTMTIGDKANVTLLAESTVEDACLAYGVSLLPNSTFTVNGSGKLTATARGSGASPAAGAVVWLNGSTFTADDVAQVTLTAESGAVGAIAAKNTSSTASNVNILSGSNVTLTGGSSASLWMAEPVSGQSAVLRFSMNGGTLTASNPSHPVIAAAGSNSVTMNITTDFTPSYLQGVSAETAKTASAINQQSHYLYAGLSSYTLSAAVKTNSSDPIAPDYAPQFEIAGVQIRTASPSGIRFVARISTDLVNQIAAVTGQTVTYGILLQKESSLKSAGGQLTFAKVTGGTLSDGAACAVPGGSSYKEYTDYLYYTAVVVDMPSSAYLYDLVARAYIKCGSTYYYSTEVRPAGGYHSCNAEAVGGGYSTSLLAVASALQNTNSSVASMYSSSLAQLNNYVIACDQRYSKLRIYNMSSASTSNVAAGEVATISSYYDVDDAKVRYNTVAGNVIVYAGNNRVGVLNYDTHASLYSNTTIESKAKSNGWISTTGNIHSAEILPNGTLVVGTANEYMVYFLRWNGSGWDSTPFARLNIVGGHTVMFDGNYLWACDENELHRYSMDFYNTASGSETFTDHEVYTFGNGMHFMTNDFTDTNYLILCGTAVWRFNKTTGEVEQVSCRRDIKGLAVTPTGRYVYTQAEGDVDEARGAVTAEHRTRTLYMSSSLDLTSVTGYTTSSSTPHYYKVNTYNGFYN